MHQHSRHFSMKPLAVLAAAMLSGWTAQAVAQETALDTVVVTATGYEQNVVDAPASISVITKEELEKKSYTDIADVVKNIPGVNIVGGGGSEDITMRGLSAGYTLFLVDGRPVSSGRSVNTNGADGGKQIGLPPLSMVERIEVVRGPMSSLYGSEAMGGVINIITKKIADKWTGSVTTEFTKSFNDVSNDGQQHQAYVSGALIPNLLGLRANGAYLGNDESDIAGGDDREATRAERKRRQGGLELTLTPNQDHTVKLGYQTARQNDIRTPGKSIASTGSASDYRFDKDAYALSHEGRVGDVNVRSYLQRDTSEKVQDQIKKEQVTTFNTQATLVVADKHLLTLGGQYKVEDLTRQDNKLLETDVPGAVASADRWLAALYAEADWAVSEKLSVTTGLRYDRDEFFGGHFSPRVYGIYKHTPQLTFKGGISTGYKQPGLAEATEGMGTTTGGGGWQSIGLPHNRALSIGNPDVKPESSLNYELGAAFESADKRTQSSLMAFHTNFKDKITTEKTCQAGTNNDYASWQCEFGGRKYWFLQRSINAGKAEMQGLEATLSHRLTPTLSASSSYTLTKTKIKDGEYAGQPLNKTPRHILNVALDWTVNSKLQAWTQAQYLSKQSTYNTRNGQTAEDDRVPSYATLDLGVVYKLADNASLKAGLYNVTNRKVTNDTYEINLDGRRLAVGLTVNF